MCTTVGTLSLICVAIEFCNPLILQGLEECAVDSASGHHYSKKQLSSCFFYASKKNTGIDIPAGLSHTVILKSSFRAAFFMPALKALEIYNLPVFITKS